jgi:hypothetical protein
VLDAPLARMDADTLPRDDRRRRPAEGPVEHPHPRTFESALARVVATAGIAGIGIPDRAAFTTDPAAEARPRSVRVFEVLRRSDGCEEAPTSLRFGFCVA